MTTLIDAIASFLAGVYTFDIATQISNGTFQITDWVLFSTSVILGLAGFIFIFTVFQIGILARPLQRFHQLSHAFVLPILFIVIVAETFSKVAALASIPTIFFIGLAFLLFLVAALIFTVLRDMHRIQNMSALTIAFLFNVGAMYLILSGFPDVRIIIMVIAFSAAMVLLVIIRMFRHRERQLPLFRIRDFRGSLRRFKK